MGRFEEETFELSRVESTEAVEIYAMQAVLPDSPGFPSLKLLAAAIPSWGGLVVTQTLDLKREHSGHVFVCVLPRKFSGFK